MTSAGGGYPLDGDGKSENLPPEGRIYYFLEITIDHSSGAFSGRVIKLGDGTTSLPGFDF